MAVRVDLNISLDGFATTTDQTRENPFGPDWSRLVEAYIATRTFRARVLHDTSGEGTTGIDDQYAQAYFAEVGAEIMGAGMFGLHAAADDPDWRGWWGDEPPFRVPVFVLTHSQRPVLGDAHADRARQDRTAYAAVAVLKPLSSRSATASASTESSTIAITRWLIRISAALAADESREARMTDVPIAA